MLWGPTTTPPVNNNNNNNHRQQQRSNKNFLIEWFFYFLVLVDLWIRDECACVYTKILRAQLFMHKNARSTHSQLLFYRDWDRERETNTKITSFRRPTAWMPASLIFQRFCCNFQQSGTWIILFFLLLLNLRQINKIKTNILVNEDALTFKKHTKYCINTPMLWKYAWNSILFNVNKM